MISQYNVILQFIPIHGNVLINQVQNSKGKVDLKSIQAMP